MILFLSEQPQMRYEAIRYSYGIMLRRPRQHTLSITLVHGSTMSSSILQQFALLLLAIWSRSLTTFGMKSWSHSRIIFHWPKVNWNKARSNDSHCLPRIYLDWTPVPAYDTLMHIICRTSNRYFVGLPLCEYWYFKLSIRLGNFWLNLMIRPRTGISIAQRDLYSQYRCESSDYQLLPKVPQAVCHYPSFVIFCDWQSNRFIATYLTTSRRDIARSIRYLGPTIEARIAQAKRPESEQGELPVR